MAKIIALTNQKGGVGKSTTSVCLAINYAHMGKRTLLIDADPQANATKNVLENRQDNYTKESLRKAIHSLAYQYGILKEKEFDDNENKLDGLYELLTRKATIEEVIHKTRYENLYIIPTEVELALVEQSLYNNAYVLKSYLNKVSDQFDIIIIDSAPAVNLITYNILNAADQILIPIKLDLFSIKGSFQTINYVGQVMEIMQGASLKASEIDYRVLATMVNSRLILTKWIYPILKEILGNKLLNTKIRQQEKAVLQTNNGSKHFALVEGKKRSKIADDYVMLMEELEGQVK